MSVRLRLAFAALLIGAWLVPVEGSAGPSQWLGRLDRSLAVELLDGTVHAELSGLIDLEGMFVDRRPPGLVFGGDDDVFNPRLSLFLDSHVGSRLYSLVQLRVDRGFDPRAASYGATRFDEYFVRLQVFDGAAFHLQAGKFATLFGGWVPRHDSWQNPFINAPLPYENVTIVADDAAPASAEAFLARREVADRKAKWLPIAWGPSYATGLAAFGRWSTFDYGFELKNASLSSRPRAWDGRARGFDDPSFAGRVAWRPDPAFVLGSSAQRGPFLLDKAEATLAPGQEVGDFEQTTVGLDAAYAWRRLQIWSELLLARFEVPNVDDGDTAAYYVEARYRWRPDLFPALRWNQQLFGDIDDGRGGERSWDRDGWRIDGALTWRFDARAQLKTQVSYFHQRGELQQGEQLYAAQLTIRF